MLIGNLLIDRGVAEGNNEVVLKLISCPKGPSKQLRKWYA